MGRCESGGLRDESFEGQSRGIFPGRDHPVDGRMTRQVACKRNPGLDEQIRFSDGGAVVRRVRAIGPGMIRINAESAKKGTEFPDVGADDEVRAHEPTGLRGQNAADATVFQPFLCASNRPPHHTQRATRADRGREISLGDDESSFFRQFGGDGRERYFQIGEGRREVLRAKAFERFPMQKLGPKDTPGQRRDFIPFQTGGEHRADQTADAGSGYDRGRETSFGESLDHAEMRKTSHGASAQSKPNTTGAKLIQHHAKEPLYPAAFSAEIARLSALRRHSRTISSAAFHKTGRSAPTRALDAVLDFMKRYLFPIYWVLVGIGAFLLYAYARAIRATAKIVTVGRYRWPDFPEGSVLVVWHGSAPSLLVAFTARRPNVPVKLMVSSDSRGDCVALFCRWLGFEIVRGDFLHGGWKALIDIANDVRGGTAALISPDGGGPPLFARVGAVALAS